MVHLVHSFVCLFVRCLAINLEFNKRQVGPKGVIKYFNEPKMTNFHFERSRGRLWRKLTEYKRNDRGCAFIYNHALKTYFI